MAPTFPIDFSGRKEPRKFLRTQMTKKSRKHSRGHSAKTVAEYRHNEVAIMGESEGFGSSGRVDTEMTVSGDANNHKRIKVSLDGYDSFDVPVRVLSLSKISSSEKRDFKSRLEFELEQVRAFQKKIASLSGSVVSRSCDVRSCSDGLMRTAPHYSHRSSAVSAPQGKKPAPPGRNGKYTKRGVIPHIEPHKRAVPATFENALLMKQCEALLKRLMGHKFGYAFNTPVDPVKLNIPDYFTIIKHPMDLSTVKSNLSLGQYSSPLEYAADVRLTFSNAMAYNPRGNDYHIMAETLSKFFEGRWKSIEKKLPGDGETHSAPSRSASHFETKIPTQIPPLKKKLMPVINRVKSEPPKWIMTNEDKHKIGLELEAMQGIYPDSILDVLKEQSPVAGQGSNDEIEIDMDALSDETWFKLQKLLDDYLPEKQKNQAKAEPCEMELCNESGLSNLSLQPHKGNDAPVDDDDNEDVDIVGGDDPPISSYPPIEIEKDIVLGNSKCSISSSPSRDSSSSSSDSDSSSSSESESDGDKATLKEENLDAGANFQQKQSVINGPDMKDKYTNGIISEIEQNTQSNPNSAKLDDNQEGESVPSEKLYRTALLKNRFADTILKAHEKALEKGEKRDPEKLRKEREELERLQREEKARLQAEAKAAEEARKKAEAEAEAKAAAEARKKRELEREAARQKLEEMEKAVKINENIRFLKDLEMLQATSNGDDLPSFMEEASLDLSEEMLGSFKLQGSSNPLEQLGLYMKVDDEEDDEDEPVPPPKGVEEPVDDAEEGEIDIIN